jgi:uncharacterized protein (TIGR02118 family)
VTIAFFLTFENPGARLGAGELSRLAEVVRAVPGLRQGLIYTPERTRDPYVDDGPPPCLAAQLCFSDIAALEAALEAALAPRGSLQALASTAEFPTLAGAVAAQQAMLTRAVATPAPRSVPPQGTSCTYLVAYEGVAEDPHAWLAFYLAHHAPLMARLPGVRQVEIYTRLDWCGALPWRRADCLLRNKVVFDDAAALTAALDSPIRHEMRADFRRFPPFAGRVTHFAMATLSVAP